MSDYSEHLISMAGGDGERFAKGGVIPGPTVTVKVRTVGDRTEYWEPLIGGWVPVWTAAEIEEIGLPALESIREAQARDSDG